MRATHVLKVLVFYIILLIAGFISDAVFPTFEVKKGATIFHGSLSIGLTLMNLSLLFLVIFLVIVLVSASQKREGSLNNGLLWRRLFFGLIFIFLFAGSFFGSIYVLSKKIVIDEERIVYYSLIERKEMRWLEVERMDGNFVPGNRLGLKGRGNYAWVDFITTNGESVHFSLRFMRGISELETMIKQKILKKEDSK
jgi:hypothetical protein